MKNASAAQAATCSVIGDVMEEPRKKRPAGGRGPGEPNGRQFSRNNKYLSRNEIATSEPENRAARLRSYWSEFRLAKGWDSRSRVWIVALVCDPNLPKISAKLGEAMQAYRNPKTGQIEVGQIALAAEIGISDSKVIRTAIHEMRDAGYLEYAPGRKGVGFSKFNMTVPEVKDFEDIISRGKTPGCGDRLLPSKLQREKQSAGEKSPTDVRHSRGKIPATVINNTLSQDVLDHSEVSKREPEPKAGREVAPQRNPPTDPTCCYVPRGSRKLSERRDALEARSARTGGIASPVRTNSPGDEQVEPAIDLVERLGDPERCFRAIRNALDTTEQPSADRLIALMVMGLPTGSDLSEAIHLLDSRGDPRATRLRDLEREIDRVIAARRDPEWIELVVERGYEPNT